MTELPDNEKLSPDDERVLDEVVREALESWPDEGPAPSEGTLLAYLEGQASPEQSAQIQEALLRSRTFRRAMIAMVRVRSAVLRIAQSPEALAEFDAVHIEDVPTPESLGLPPLRGRKREGASLPVNMIARLGSVLWSPAVAYALAIVISAYPVYRILTQPKSSVLLDIRKQTVFAEGGHGGITRGSEADVDHAPEARVTLPTSDEALDLFLALPGDFDPDVRHELSLVTSDGDQINAGRLAHLVSLRGRLYLTVLLPGTLLSPGRMVARITYTPLDEPDRRLEFVYRIHITVASAPR